MTRFDGSTALTLDFGGITTTATAVGRGRGGLRLAPRLAPVGARSGQAVGSLRGPDKYTVLEHRRRQAQIKARHLLELMEEAR
jgi:hypothetical protein